VRVAESPRLESPKQRIGAAIDVLRNRVNDSMKASIFFVQSAARCGNSLGDKHFRTLDIRTTPLGMERA
jgi:hypothetical protein